MRHRIATIVSAGCGLLACLGSARAQPTSQLTTQHQQPTGKITWVVSLAPGGGVDTLARILAEHMQARLKQSIVVENRAGGGGMIGASSLAKSTPDGTTIGMLESSTVLQKWLHRSVPFDVTTDFAPIALIARSPMVLFTHPTLEVSHLRDLIALAKANPGGMQVGTPGAGTTHHLAAAMLNSTAGINIVPLPYRGTSPALNDLVGGHVKMIWATPVAVMPFIEAGKVKALVTTSPRRMAILPDLPTVAESGYPGFDLESWFGVAAPAKTPRTIIESYQNELRAIVAQPDVQTRITAQSFWIDFRDGAAFHEMLVREHNRLGAEIRKAGIGPN